MSDQKVIASSAVMAVGTAFSRLSGFLRGALLVAALGTALQGELFTIANTLPNMIYILVAGGVFNAVLVPQLVRSQKSDLDGGDAYANRVITLAGLFLGAVTVVLIVVTPLVIRLFLSSEYDDPDHAAHLQSVIDLTRLCLPQVFFYGMFVLVGQILNARGKFGPMMWAPIANNVVAVLMLAAYLLLYGRAGEAEQQEAFASGQELLLGVGSTLGIALQLLILLPYLKAAGFGYRPRFDFRDAGLTRTLSLGMWTVLFVVVNQLAYVVVVNLASSGPVRDPSGTGYAVYSMAFLILMVPHSIVTVSLATAILPTISAHAAENRLREMGASVGSTLRTTLSVMLPFAALLGVLSYDVANVLFGWGKDHQAARIGPTLTFFAPGLVFFTVHYLMLRGFYALEQTRRVFFIQCAISATNIVLAIVLVHQVSAVRTAPALALAYLGAYAVGSVISYTVLSGVLGDLQTPRLVRFLVRMLVVVAVAGLAAWLVKAGVSELLGPRADDPHPLVSAGRGGLAGAVGLVVVLVLARALRIREVTSLTHAATSRLRRRRVLG
ncbi:MAG: integral rane protein MviN [Nocardioides sp.]|jgi:putative peptidoglycan lipid II flippase|uniref:murein biosynthesis integral membrane protein MurJ n=1 Tax=Nocardioides sp. TaxID=35761 RepID=UPI0026245BB7|nr:murein biosynthesis integral membrane protein MurJ [Nocardioides sp.]MCW2833133.1 integral rane protein MviN [Nocardioides sp.]